MGLIETTALCICVRLGRCVQQAGGDREDGKVRMIHQRVQGAKGGCHQNRLLRLHKYHVRAVFNHSQGFLLSFSALVQFLGYSL